MSKTPQKCLGASLLITLLPHVKVFSNDSESATRELCLRQVR